MAKKKILTISDHPLIPSGVGIQSKYMIEGLLKTGKYTVFSWGSAMKHPDYRIQKVFPELYGDDWLIQPIDGYGDRDRMRQFLLTEKPDALIIVTDPRFYTWLFEMADEIKRVCPIIYWHVWDNDPTPEFNEAYYETIDHMAPLSLKTYGLLQDMKNLGKYKGAFSYVPHAVPHDQFKPVAEDEVMKFRKDRFGPHWNKKFVLFWNNRNARRKQPGDLIVAFSKFLEEVGKNNAALLLQTQVKDQEGQDIIAVAKKFGCDANLIISENRVTAEEMNMFYNSADCTINVSNNEGFGLSTLESLFCGTPIITHMTGGLQFQTGDWWKDLTDFSDQDTLTAIAKQKWKSNSSNWWGVPVFSTSRSCTGSQQIPYIYDDRFDHEDVVEALMTVYDMGRPKRKAIGIKAREWAQSNFSMDKLTKSWDIIVEETIASGVKNNSSRIITL